MYIISFYDGISMHTIDAPYDLKLAKTKFNNIVNERKPILASLISKSDASIALTYKEPTTSTIGSFSDTGKTICQQGSRYTAIWTDGVLLKQKDGKAQLLTDNIEMSEFKLIESERYRVTVEHIKGQ
jgi:hypothetical protein